MNEVIVNKTKYDRNTFTHLNKKILNKRLILLCVICGVLVIAGILMIIFDFFVLVGWLYIVAGIIMPVAMVIRLNAFIKKSVEENLKIVGEVEVVYNFYDDYLETIIMENGVEKVGKNNYKDYFKIIEDKSFIFLFVNQSNAQCVNKDNFALGDLEKVVEILKPFKKKRR